MAKKSSGSRNGPQPASQPAKRISVNAESIFNRPLTKRQQQALGRLAARPESGIDYSDIPPLSEEQLASAKNGSSCFPPFPRTTPTPVPPTSETAAISPFFFVARVPSITLERIEP